MSPASRSAFAPAVFPRRFRREDRRKKTRTGEFPVSLSPTVDLPGVALAAGAGFGATVTDPAELPQVLKDALATVQAGRSAVVSVRLPPV